MSRSKTCLSSRSLLTTLSMLTCTLGTSWFKAWPMSGPAARSRQPSWTCVTRLWWKCSRPSGSSAWCCWTRGSWQSYRALICRTSGRFSRLWSRARWGFCHGAGEGRQLESQMVKVIFFYFPLQSSLRGERSLASVEAIPDTGITCSATARRLPESNDFSGPGNGRC